MRVDYNVPLKNNSIVDDTRITATLPTIKTILRANPKCLILMSHLGRPEGRIKSNFSLKPVVSALEDNLNHNVTFLDNCIGEITDNICKEAHSGQIILLENLRFHPEEEGSYLDEKNNKV